MEFKHTLIFFIFAHYLKLHRDALMGMFWSGDSLPVVPRQAAATARPCSSPDTLRGMETWQGFRLCPRPRPPLPQALLQADFAPDAAALAESNLKGFANTSMVLIETNIHQSASRSDSTSSGKDHSSPADLGTVSWQQPWSSMATGSLLPVLPVPQG